MLHKQIPSHCLLYGALTAFGWLWDGDYAQQWTLKYIIWWPAEHIKNKAQRQRHTSAKIICVSVHWPLEMSLMKMSDLIYSSASWLWTTFHLGTNAKKGKSMNCTRDFNDSELYDIMSEGLHSSFHSSGRAPRSTHSLHKLNDMNTTDGVRHYLNSPRPCKSQWHVIRTLKYFYVLVWFAASAGFRCIR